MIGEKGIRDPDARCEFFDPVDDIDFLGLSVKSPRLGDCSADGHYLCLSCQALSKSSWMLPVVKAGFTCQPYSDKARTRRS